MDYNALLHWYVWIASIVGTLALAVAAAGAMLYGLYLWFLRAAVRRTLAANAEIVRLKAEMAEQPEEVKPNWEDTVGTIHSANIAKSSRLQKVLAVLSDHRPHSTWNISQRTRSVAVHTDIAELRANGHRINTALLGPTADGRRVYTYQLVREVGHV